MKKLLLIFAIFIIIFFVFSPQIAPCAVSGSYNFTVFDAPGAKTTIPQKINDADNIVGFYYDTNDSIHSFYYDGNFQVLKVPGAWQTFARGINNNDQIVGTFMDPNGNSHGFIYDGEYTVFNVPEGRETTVNDINNAHKIVGSYHDYSSGYFTEVKSFLYDGTMTILNVPNTQESYAICMNNADKIVGNYNDNNTNTWRNFLYDGIYIPLYILGCFTPQAGDINDADKITGYYIDSNFDSHGYLYDGSFTTFDFPEGSNTHANGINNADKIVGWFTDTNGTSHGFIATPVQKPITAQEINVPMDYSSIQEAINHSNNGDVISVHPGIYFENINFLGKAITVKSIDPNDPDVVAATVIDGNQIDTVVVFNNGEWHDTILCGIAIQNGQAAGAGINCNHSSPTIHKCIIKNNHTPSGDCGGGIYCSNFSSPIIKDCFITQNSAGRDGGGIYCLWHSFPTISKCIISNNTVNDFNGGGICLYDYCSSIIINCIITNNSAKTLGGGIHAWTFCNLNITNCTIADNTVLSENGGAISCGNSSLLNMNNSILWSDLPDEIYIENSTHFITYSNIQGGYSGTGNISSLPLFVDPNGSDYHLQPNSPCIDMGSFISLNMIDIDNALRPQDGDGDGISVYDMGAYENQTASSFDFKSELFADPWTLYLFGINIDKNTGILMMNGVDTTPVIGAFTWDWGDGIIDNGWFPQQHTYTDVTRNYPVKVISNYTTGNTVAEEIFIRFIAPSICPISLPTDISVAIPSTHIPVTGPGDPNFLNTLTYLDDTFFNIIPRSTIEYILTVAASIQKDFVNDNIEKTDGDFKQYLLRQPTFQGIASLWATNPVIIMCGNTEFQGPVQWIQLFRVIAHGFIFNTPSNYSYGERINGNAIFYFGESMGHIFQQATLYEIINNYDTYGLSNDILSELKSNAKSAMKFITLAYANYLNTGMNFVSWNDPNTQDDESFFTYMTLAYKFCEHAENTGLGYRIPLKRMMRFLQIFDEDLSRKYDQLHNTSEADTFRATLMVTALSYSFSEDLRTEFRALNFPVSDEIYEMLIYRKNTTVKFEWTIPDTYNWFFKTPHGIVADKSGNIYVADTYNCRIKTFSSDGTFIKEWGNFGHGDGQLNYPQGIALDTAGYIYVADSSASRIQKFSPDGNFLGKWGSPGSGDGQFMGPAEVATDPNGNIFVTDSGNNRIQKFSPNGLFLDKWGSLGSDDGEFNYPDGIAIDESGNIYVTDNNNHRIQKFSSDGNFLTKWGSYGSEDGKFSSPSGIAIDASGNIYVADQYNGRIQKFLSDGTFLDKWDIQVTGNPIGITLDITGNVYVTNWDDCIQKFTSNGTFLTKWCSVSTEDGVLNWPRGIAVNTNANIYIADSQNHRIQKFSSDGTFLDKWGNQGSADGQFNLPCGITIDENSNIYVADSQNHRIQKFSSDGTFLDKWGNQGSADGQFNFPFGIALDENGNIYIADSQNHRIQKFSSDGTFLDKWGNQGSADGQFNWPEGIAVDANNNIYVADVGNNRIQKFTSDGIFIAKYGSIGPGDIEFNQPNGIAIDKNGNIYVANQGNDSIQQLSSDGTLLTKWGSSGSGYGEFDWPNGIAVDTNDNIYVADTANNRIQKFTLLTDSDKDGLSNEIELSSGTDPYSADTDNDGLVDGNIGSEDLNVNGIVDPGETDPKNPDTDGDGIFDGTEKGLTEPESADTDLFAGYFIPDADPNTTTDPTDADSDDDGILDGNEDKNHNGKIETNLGETDPDNPDTDGDGIYDATEIGLTEPQDPNATDQSKGLFIPDADPNTITDPANPDSDGDHVLDGIEDSNKDGAFNPELDESDPEIPDDYDNDGFKVSDGDCDNLDPHTYPGAEERCDEKDNNCNEEIDEGFNLQTDPNNCGFCNNICPLYPHASTLCMDGNCVLGPCDSGWNNLDADPNNGCESPEKSIEMHLPAGWNMLSLPVIPQDKSVSALFPDAEIVYGFDTGSGYIPLEGEEELVVGKGYWILLDQNQIYTLTGQPIESYYKTVNEDGWEMIGSCTYAAQSLSNNCDIGVIYGYVPGIGYQRIPESEDLEPGKGYWILFKDVTDEASVTVNIINSDFIELLYSLGYPAVVSINAPNLQGEELYIHVSGDQTEILTKSPDNPQIISFNRDALNEDQLNAIKNFEGKNKIALARRIDRNNNELLFSGNNECNNINYVSIYLDQILPSDLGDQCPFEYTEYRSMLSGRTIIKPSMKLKQNKKIVLKEGLYFFESLTLEEGSIISTEGNVLIYVTALELKKEAQLMGGSINSPNPNHLIVLAEYWDGYPYNSSINMVKIGPGARVYAHIFAPNLKVILARGSTKDTKVYGSILTRQLVAYKDSESFGGLIGIIHI